METFLETSDAPDHCDDFSVALVCALPLEADCILALLDNQWESTRYSLTDGDRNAYTLGSMAGHNVVVVHMPGMGTVSAAGVAASLTMSFPRVCLAIVVGVCGGVPTGADEESQVFLGDVIVSSTLIQYDLGREYPRGFRVKTRVEDSLSRADPAVRAVVNRLKTTHHRQNLEERIMPYLREVNFKLPATKDPGSEYDILFDSSYIHQHRRVVDGVTCHECHEAENVCKEAVDATCDELGCDPSFWIKRKRTERSLYGPSLHRSHPSIHFAAVASGNKVMKSARERDRLARNLKIGAFEMESAGVSEFVPTIVLKGVCDYADCHKNKRFQRFAAATAAACVKAVLTEMPVAHAHSTNNFRVTANSVTSTQALNRARELSFPIRMVPISSLSHYIGRQRELAELEAKLFNADEPQRAAIIGPAGIGKTRLALEIASRRRSHVPAISVFWVQASTRETVERDYAEIAKALGKSTVRGTEIDLKSSVQRRLDQTSTGKWLFILDNADDENLWGQHGILIDFLPRSTRHGAVLVTTRTRRVGHTLATSNFVILPPLKKDEAIRLIEQQMRDRGKAESEVVAVLLEKLDYLPLAIVQAAAYMAVTGTSPADYLALMEDREKNVIELLEEDFAVDGRYVKSTNSVLSTWRVSFEQIRSRDQLAADYLAFMSCLGKSQIPRSLIREAVPRKRTNDALGLLKAYSLITEQDGHFNMSGLIRLAVRSWLEGSGSLQYYTTHAINQVEEVWPSITWGSRSVWISYLPHAQALCEPDICDNLPSKYSLLSKLGHCMLITRRDQESREKLETAARWQGEHLGHSHREALYTQGRLGGCLIEFGHWDRSQQMLEYAYREALAQFGQEDELTLENMGRLASLYLLLKQLADAETLLVTLYKTTKGLYGLPDERTLGAGQELADVYSKGGQLEKATKLLEEIMAAARSVLPPEHPVMMNSAYIRATTLRKEGRVDEAEAAYLQLLSVVKGSQGHHDLLMTRILYGLASLHLRQKRFSEAENRLMHALELRTLLVGRTHWRILAINANLARLYYMTGRRKEALSMMEENVDLAIKTLGERSSRTKQLVANLKKMESSSTH